MNRPGQPEPRVGRSQEGSALVRSVDRAAHIITVLAESPHPIGIVALAGRVGLSPGSVHRLLATLQSLGWVEQNSRTSKYRLGNRLLGIGATGLVANPVVQDGTTYLARLAERTGHDALLSTLVGTRTVHLGRVAGVRTRRTAFEPGLSQPAHAMADGKLLLAYLPQDELDYLLGLEDLVPFTPQTIVDPEALRHELATVREQGYAVDRGERFADGFGVAVPVLGFDQRPIMAMLCVGSLSLDPENLTSLVNQMRSACGEFADHLIKTGHMPAPRV